METPWKRASRKRASQLQEERLDTMPGGLKTVNSGRFWRWKRDGRLWEYLIETRTTDANSYSVSHDEFLAIEREAKTTPPGLLPGMQVDIRELQLVVVRLNDFQEMQMELDSLRTRLARHEEPVPDLDPEPLDEDFE